jgi:amino acid adenylation domain-containing protein
MSKAGRAVWMGFMRSAEHFTARPAIIVEGKSLSYGELREAAVGIAATIQSHQEPAWVPLTAVFAHRSATAFAGVLGSLLAGNGYVPLNRTFPIARSRVMFERSRCRSVVVDNASLPQLESLLDDRADNLLIIAPDLANVSDHRLRWPQHCFIGSDDLSGSHAWCPPSVHPDDIAYLLFTSGSTGTPKGVMVSHGNVVSCIDYLSGLFDFTEKDVVSQMFDLTFDLSAFDMFVSWAQGACLCCASQKTLINPARFIRERGLTTWFSVPSTIAFMKRLGLLKPGMFPSLRLSLFCGEPLPVAAAEAWSRAAPNSIVENLYGPTELTIACTSYRWDPERCRMESELGIVPIGRPFPGMNVLVVDDTLREVDPGQEGELLMNGPQMSLGYWRDRERTNRAFVVPIGRTDTFYRTGDRVRRSVGTSPMTHLGRIDSQIKVLGHRVELGEIEAVVRQTSGLDGVAAVGWPETDSGYAGVEVFIEGDPADLDELRRRIGARLPEYMVPRRFHFMGRLPRNANEKLDRIAMQGILGGCQ